MNKKDEALRLALEAAYLAGFNASGEGCNGEYPYRDHCANPEQDVVWAKERSDYVTKALADHSEDALNKVEQQEFQPDWMNYQQGHMDGMAQARADTKLEQPAPSSHISHITDEQKIANGLAWLSRMEVMREECAALAEQPAQQRELDELTAQRDNLADILTRTANALKGQPAELSLHSWHDLPEVAKQLKAAQQQEPVAWMFQHGETGRTLCVDAQQVKWGFEERNPRYQKIAPLYTSPPASKPLTDNEIIRLVPGLYDCLCDPYDCDKSGDDYASIPKDMIRLARAVEAVHGISATGETTKEGDRG